METGRETRKEEPKDLKKKLVKRWREWVKKCKEVKALGVGMFVMGSLWVPLLPAVSVSTGELKVRSTYFDETTLAPLATRTTFDVQPGFRKKTRWLNDSGLWTTELGTGWEHAVVRPASGAAALDAVVLAAVGDEARTMAVLLAEFLATAPWLAKNIVVVTAVSDAAVSDWLDAYASEKIMDRGGVVRAGLVLRAQSSSSSSSSSSRQQRPAPWVRLRTRGGACNLDLVHLTAASLFGFAGVETCCLGACVDSRGLTYLDRARGLLAWTCGTLYDGPAGPHALFGDRLGADGLGLDIDVKRAEIEPLSVGLELVIRSLNTVEHRLHHSFFLYWLSDAGHFVSVDEYAWPLMALYVSYLLAAYRSLTSDKLDSYERLKGLLNAAWVVVHAPLVLSDPVLAFLNAFLAAPWLLLPVKVAPAFARSAWVATGILWYTLPSHSSSLFRLVLWPVFGCAALLLFSPTSSSFFEEEEQEALSPPTSSSVPADNKEEPSSSHHTAPSSLRRRPAAATVRATESSSQQQQQSSSLKQTTPRKKSQQKRPPRSSR